MWYKVKKIYQWTNLVRPYNFATQWPCPDGFHVPLESECEAMYNMWISLGAWTSSTPSNIKTYLKLPAAWDRSRTTWSVEGQWGTTWVYWSASVNSSNLILTFWFDSSSVYYNLWQYRSLGRPIRAFRNNPIVPDNTWTVLKAWTWNAGIFWSSTLWLISISSNGTTWITLADKNLWATTVYNDWDTQTEANCGKYYQWGNNYGFPFTWSVTTSSTKVNAGSYWPWNYYSSSTFITVNTWAPNSWDSSNNNNLRWWVDWNIPK